MARLPRRQLDGGLMHVTARSCRGLPLFVNGQDALAMLSLLDHVGEAVADWRVLAYCFMPNHVHLVIEAEISQLSLAMHRVNGGYAQRFNRVHGYRGHLFQGRFHAKPLREEAHLLECVRYVLLNPVRAGLCKRPEDWRWSSYRAAVGISPTPRFLASHQLAVTFHTSPANYGSVLRGFVEAALAAPPEAGTVPGTVPARSAPAAA